MRKLVRHVWQRLEKGREWAGRKAAWIGAYADIAALALVGLTASLALAHSAELPSADAWSTGNPLPPSQVVAVALLVFAQVVIVIRGRKRQRNRELEDACREVAAYMDEQCPALPLREVGIHIWTVAGPPFAKHLRRSGGFLLVGTRARSGIRWSKGKGVVGVAWRKKAKLIRDLDAVHRRAASSELFDALPGEDQFGLSWDEFSRTKRYRVVCANPLYGRENTGATPTVRGVLAIDVLKGGHFGEVEAATEGSRFDSVVGLCESALES